MLVAALLVGSLAGTADSDVQVVAISPGSSADLVIGGGSPVTIEVGGTVEGVTLIEANRRSAVVRIHGVAKTLPLVAYRGSTSDDAAESLTLLADAGGHFMASGAVNGTPLRFIVDTGSTWTALSRAHADRIGLDYQSGAQVQSMTVNGVVRGWRVSLDSVRIGTTTERDVEAVVIDNETLPIGLLGMSFLNRFDMHRQGATLVLKRRR